MTPAPVDGERQVVRRRRPVHRLQEEVLKVERSERRQVEAALRPHDLQLVAGPLHQRRAGLGADTDPVEPSRGGVRAVGLHGDLKAEPVQGIDQGDVELKERFAACADDVAALILLRRNRGAPAGVNGPGERLGRGEAATALAVHTYEISVTEGADRVGPIILATSP